MNDGYEISHYKAGEYAGFLRSKDTFGAFSNMNGKFPLFFAGLKVDSSESLYQALRFPSNHELQKRILDVGWAMGAKKVAYEEQSLIHSTPGWVSDGINTQAMLICLYLKLHQHRKKLTALHDLAGGRPIVEISYRDDFWGAKPVGEERLGDCIGKNALGKLWDKVFIESSVLTHDNYLPMVASLSEKFQFLGKPLSELVMKSEIDQEDENETLSLF